MTTTPHSEPGTLTFFTDECLGRLVPNALKDAGLLEVSPLKHKGFRGSGCEAGVRLKQLSHAIIFFRLVVW